MAASDGTTALRSAHWGPSAPALLTVANRPLLAHALDWLDAGGVREAAIVASPRVAAEATTVVESGAWDLEADLVALEGGETLGQTLADLSGFVDGEPFVLHLADSLAREPLDTLAAAAPTPLDSFVVVHQAEGDPGTVVDIRNLRRGAWAGHPELATGEPAGVAVFGSEAVRTTPELDAWPGREVEALVRHLGARGGRVEVLRADAWWRFRPGPDALLEGNRFALENVRESRPTGEIVDTRIQGIVDVHPTARIESSVVRGPVVIGPGARLRDAYVGPYTSIGPDVVIEGAEIEHSIVMREASIRHLGGRLEASVVGPQARVIRDFRLPRAVRLSVGQGAEVSLP